MLGGPSDPGWFLDGDAAITLATRDAGFARQVELALRAAKLRVKRSADVSGVGIAAAPVAERGPDPQLATLEDPR